MDIGHLYLDSLDVSVPVIFLTAVGLCAAFKMFPPKLYQLISNLTFKISLPIIMIYTIGTQTITTQDLRYGVAHILASYSMAIIAVPQAFMYRDFMSGLGYLIVMVDVHNATFSGVPVCEGLYNAEICYKYGYLGFAFTNAFVLPFVYILLEVSANRGEQSTAARILGKAVKAAVLSPMVIAVFIGLLYCVVEMYIYPPLRSLPIYFSRMFEAFGDFASSSALVMLGIFLFREVQMIREGRSARLMSKKEMMSFALIVVHRHLTAPILLIVYSKLLDVAYEIAEPAAVIFSGPTAVLAFSVCDQYSVGTFAAGIECCLGVFVGLLVIPIVQLFTRLMYGIE